jgi:hypothetical protein
MYTASNPAQGNLGESALPHRHYSTGAPAHLLKDESQFCDL